MGWSVLWHVMTGGRDWIRDATHTRQPNKPRPGLPGSGQGNWLHRGIEGMNQFHVQDWKYKRDCKRSNCDNDPINEA